MTRPLHGSNLAPKDDGGLYDVVHLCDGLVTFGGSPYEHACRYAQQDNAFQDDPASLICDTNGEQCLGFAVWRRAR